MPNTQKNVQTLDIQGNTYTVPVGKLGWRPSAYSIIVHNEEILLTKQHGKYHLPGGGLNLGESPQEAAIREVKEETGVTIGNPRLLDTLTNFFTWEDTDKNELVHVQSLLFFYRCDFLGGNLSTAGLDAYEKRDGATPHWLPLHQFDSIPKGSTYDWGGLVLAALNRHHAHI